jgi:hypothetical protein
MGIKRTSIEKNREIKRLSVANARKLRPRYGKARRPPNPPTAEATANDEARISGAVIQKVGTKSGALLDSGSETNAYCNDASSPAYKNARLNEPATKAIAA